MFRALLTALLWPAALLSAQRAASAESWVSEYTHEAALEEQDCVRPQLNDCRRELLRLAALLDSRTDILNRLSKLEAKLGRAEASLAYLESYAYSQLDFGDPATQPECLSLTAPGTPPALWSIELPK